MNKQSIIIYNFDILFNILDEVKENLKFNLINLDKEKEILEIDVNKYGNYLVLIKSSQNFSNIIYKNNRFLFIKFWFLVVNIK